MPKGVRINWKAMWPTVERMLGEDKLPSHIARELNLSPSAINAEMRRRHVKVDPAVAARHRAEVLRRIGADPAVQAKKAASVTKAMREPARRALQGESSRKAWSDPEARARRIARITANANKPENIEARRRAGSMTKIPHIPEAYRDLYRTLREKHLTPAEAAEAVQSQIRADRAAEAARVAALPPHERQLEKVRKGQAIVNRADLWKHHGNDNVASYGIASGLLA